MDSPDQVDLSIVEFALKIRAFEKALLETYAAGKIRGTIHTSMGQEYLPIVLTKYLLPQDFLFGTHRSHALYLAYSEDFDGLAKEILGKQDATSKGLGGSQHLHFRHLFTNGIQAGMLPISVGSANALSNSNSIGEPQGVAVCVIGDGTLGEGLFYETLNIASNLNSPLLLIIEDNKIAQSTNTELIFKTSIEKKVNSFGIPAYRIDSQDLESLQSCVSQVLDEIRGFNRPICLIVDSQRLGPHSKGDDNRSDSLISKLEENDSLNRLMKRNPELKKFFDQEFYFFLQKISDMQLEPNSKEVFIDHAANAIKDGVISSMSDDTLFDRTSTFREMFHESICEIFTEWNEAVMVGEDIVFKQSDDMKPYLGAFGVSRDLSEKFPGRIINFPIAEAGIVGFAIGRALAGKPTVAEIMFSDFLTLTIDQLKQQASKLVSMYGILVRVPILIRFATGGRRGYGPTHSQNFESYFFGTPNLIVYVSNIFSKRSDYSSLMHTGLPVIAAECKELYNFKTGNFIPDLYKLNFTGKNGEVCISPKSKVSDTLILTYGHATSLVVDSLTKLAYEEEKFFHVLALKVVSPLNLEEVLNKIGTNWRTIALIEECDSRVGLLSLLFLELNRLNVSSKIKTLGGTGDIGASEFAEDFATIHKLKVEDFLQSL